MGDEERRIDSQQMETLSPQESPGAWIRSRRKQLDLTQEELARRTGCALVTIQKIETGTRRPSKPLARLISRSLELTGDDETRFLQLARQSGSAVRPLTQPNTGAIKTQGAVRAARRDIPAPLTSLVGRGKEIEAIQNRILHTSTRFITLIGPPGVGKTRLAIQVATELADQAFDAVCFVSLEAITDPNLVLPTIAHSLGITQAGPKPLPARLKSYLFSRKVLLVLDNFEQVVTAGKDLAEICQTCPRLSVLITSRIPLELMGEHLYPVEPFHMPEVQQEGNADNLLEWEAVRLFIERVQAFQSGFLLTDQNARSVAEICLRLDGLPLALELAAARIRTYTPQDLVAQFDSAGSPLPALHARFQDLPPRHRTLQSAIAWSYELLSEPEKKAFRSLGVFAGGCTVESACQIGDISADEMHILLDHNLVRVEPGKFDRPRYAMLDTIRHFALEQLNAAGEANEIQRKHASYFKSLVETHPTAPPQEQSWMDAEIDNLRLAIRWFLDQQNALEVLEFCGAASQFLEFFGYQREACNWLKEALALPGKVPAGLRIGCLHNLCLLSWQHANFEEGLAAGSQALQLGQEEGDQSQVAHSHLLLGRIALEQGKFALAGEHFSASQAAAMQGNSILERINAAWHLSELASAQMDWQRARELCLTGLALLSTVSDGSANFWYTFFFQILSEIDMENGRWNEALEWLQQSLKAARKTIALRPLTLVLATIAGFVGTHPNAQSHQILHSAALMAGVEAIRDQHGFVFSVTHQRRISRRIEYARTRVDPKAWKAAWQEGRGLTLELAIASGERLVHQAHNMEEQNTG